MLDILILEWLVSKQLSYWSDFKSIIFNPLNASIILKTCKLTNLVNNYVAMIHI